MSCFDKYTNEELEELVNLSNNWSEMLRRLDVYDGHNKMVPLLKVTLHSRNIDYNKLDTSLPLISRKKYSDDEIFCQNKTISSSVVRQHLLSHNEIPYKCAICGLDPVWQGKPLVLTMDHIDGNHTNHSLDNLRWICPNCDRQLPTYAGRNKTKEYKKERVYKNTSKICPYCGSNKDYRAEMCHTCRKQYNESHLAYSKDEKLKPSRNELKSEIRESSFESIGRKYGVSGNAVKKWCKLYGLPFKKSEINSISDKDWKRV